MQDALPGPDTRDSNIEGPSRHFTANQPPEPAPPVRRRATAHHAGSENEKASAGVFSFSPRQPDSELSTSPFDEVDSPGLYVEHRTGILIRVLHDGIGSELGPLIQVVTREPWVVTKISSDPFMTRTRARAIVSDLGFHPNF